ncbi:CDK5 regulatory subunit-associated protein 2-like [Pseudophryne corroboree]|uniref:CDK5 regulatory subunit-associated protein 2-like n=1 Tax=Pseudophryne corroboree TaxID=495146 RepID=UPI003081A0E8
MEAPPGRGTPGITRSGPESLPPGPQSIETERDSSPGERRHPGEYSERDSPSDERQPPGQDNKRDRTAGERQPSGKDKESTSGERHHPGEDNKRDSQSGGRHPSAQDNETDRTGGERQPSDKKSTSGERHHPGEDNQRDSQSGGRHPSAQDNETDRTGGERQPSGKDKESTSGERYHPGEDDQRDSLSGGRHPSGNDSERDLLSGETLLAWIVSERDCPSGERHPSGNDSDRDFLPVERHLPVSGGFQRPHLPISGAHTLERDSLCTESASPRRDGYVRLPVQSAFPGRVGYNWLPTESASSVRDGYDRLRTESASPGRVGYDWHNAEEGAPPGRGGYDRLSVERAHTMKDFEKQITELKKENFNLKLRIYFLEEQVQRRCDNSSEELHRMNIELRVEVESLKHEFQEKQKLLVRASKAVESLAGEHGSAVQRLREEHLRQLQDIEDPHNQNIHLLQEELAQKAAELENVCALLDQERLQRFNSEERLLVVKEQYTKCVGILAERDWIIQCLNETLLSKDALIAQLEKQIAAMIPCETSNGSSNANSAPSLFSVNGAGEDGVDASDPMCNVDNALKSLEDKEKNVNEFQEKMKEMDSLLKDLQQKLEANKAASAIEERNALKRDKAIQGLTTALKTKTKENNKLLNEIDHLKAVLAKARESAQFQNLKENIDPEYRKLVFTLQSEQEMYSRLLRYERESGSLQKELDAISMLRRWLEENIQANQELRKIMEAQIMSKYGEGDTLSFIGDQTSYLSICLDHLDPNYDYFAGEQNERNIDKQNSSITENGKALSLFLMKDNGTQTEDQVPEVTEGDHIKSFYTKDQIDCTFGMLDKKSDTLTGDSPANSPIQPKKEKIDHKRNTVSSCSQTELKYYADKSTLVDLRKENAEDIGDLGGGKDLDIDLKYQPFPLQVSKSSCDITRGLQPKQRMNQCTKKSRLPVLQKSFSYKKFKTDAQMMISNNQTHVCQEEELEIENCRLYNQLRSAEMEIESLKANEASVKGLDNTSNMDDPNKVEAGSSEHTLQQELQLENYRLSEQLKYAQMEIEKLQSGGVKHMDLDMRSDLKNTSGVGRENSEQSPLKVLQMDNNRLSQHSEQMQLDKCHANKVLDEALDNGVQLDHSGAGDGYFSNLSLDKTITNSINAGEAHDEKSYFEGEVCRPSVDGHVPGTRCQHDNFCAECANNSQSLLLQTATSIRVSAMHQQSKFPNVPSSGRSFEDTTSLSKYDLLVQSQARELSLQRQKIKESHNLSIICSKNFFNLLKAFKDLLPNSDLDTNIALAFQEQLTQTIEWLKELEYKLSDALYGEEDAYSDHSADSSSYTPSRLVPGHRMWADKRGCHVLGLVEDYNALHKQIVEAKNVLQETEAFIDHGVQTALLNMTEHFGNIFFEKLSRTKQSLEEANSLLKLLWRVSLPLQIHSSYSIHQEEETNREITRLRKRVFEQEQLLSGMVKRVYSENQMKEDIEKLILDQLAMTHDILRRAKGNLEVQVVDKRH